MTSISARVTDSSGPHTRVSVFVGPDADHRALVEVLVFRNGEEAEFLRRLETGQVHRPTVTLGYDVFPDDSLLLDREEGDDYTAVDVAKEAWEGISHWSENGYLPIVTVHMPDGTVETVDLEEET